MERLLLLTGDYTSFLIKSIKKKKTDKETNSVIKENMLVDSFGGIAHFNRMYFILTEPQGKCYTDEVMEGISSERFVQFCVKYK